MSNCSKRFDGASNSSGDEGGELHVTKAEIVDRVVEEVGWGRRDVGETVDLVFEMIKSRLENGETVKLSGFGNFFVLEKKPRRGRNPQTGESLTLRGRRVLSFKASPVLKAEINGEESAGHEVEPGPNSDD